MTVHGLSWEARHNARSTAMLHILKRGWISRQELSEELGITPHTVTGIMSSLRVKGERIQKRPAAYKRTVSEFRLNPNPSKTGDIEYFDEVRSVTAIKDLLIVEMNKVRIAAENLGVHSIEKMARQALNAAGIITESTLGE